MRAKKKDNRGLSIVELVIVIAIMAVLLGVLGFSLSMLIGNEAKQASSKMDAQLNDIKMGAMSRAGEYMVVRYIDINAADKSTQKAMAELGVDKPGFYTEKHISTINNSETNLKMDYGGVEYTRIASKKVEINIEGREILADGTNAARIEYDRKTGRLKDVEILVADGTPTPIAAGVAATETFSLNEMTFKAGLRTYEIDFNSETGRHTLVK